MVKVTNAEDNPDHEDREREKQRERDRVAEAQRSRDSNQRRVDQGTVGAAVGTEASTDLKNTEAQQGRGPSGLNTGASDTVSGDPHRPSQALDHSRTTGGTGMPPARGAGTHDASGGPLGTGGLPETDAQRRARLNPSDDAKQAGQKSAEEQRAATDEKTDALAALKQDEENIRRNQAPGANAPQGQGVGSTGTGVNRAGEGRQAASDGEDGRK